MTFSYAQHKKTAPNGIIHRIWYRVCRDCINSCVSSKNLVWEGHYAVLPKRWSRAIHFHTSTNAYVARAIQMTMEKSVPSVCPCLRLKMMSGKFFIFLIQVSLTLTIYYFNLFLEIDAFHVCICFIWTALTNGWSPINTAQFVALISRRIWARTPQHFDLINSIAELQGHLKCNILIF